MGRPRLGPLLSKNHCEGKYSPQMAPGRTPFWQRQKIAHRRPQGFRGRNPHGSRAPPTLIQCSTGGGDPSARQAGGTEGALRRPSEDCQPKAAPRGRRVDGDGGRGVRNEGKGQITERGLPYPKSDHSRLRRNRREKALRRRDCLCGYGEGEHGLSLGRRNVGCARGRAKALLANGRSHGGVGVVAVDVATPVNSLFRSSSCRNVRASVRATWMLKTQKPMFQPCRPVRAEAAAAGSAN